MNEPRYCVDCYGEQPSRTVRAIWEVDEDPLCPVHLKMRGHTTKDEGVGFIGGEATPAKSPTAASNESLCKCGRPARHRGRCAGYKPPARIIPAIEPTAPGRVFIDAEHVEMLAQVLDRWWGELDPQSKVRIFSTHTQAP
jgi:hypothetical protein